MCDFTTILSAIALAQVLLAGAIALTVAAIAVNGSFFGAPGAIGPFIGAIVAATAAAASLATASTALDSSACAAAGACTAELAAARGAIDFLTATMTATAIMGFVAMPLSGVPIAGAIAMGGYSAGLIIAAIGIGPATSSIAALQRCADAAASTRVADVLVVTGFIVSLIGIGFLIVVGGGSRNGGGDDGRDPFDPLGRDKPA